MLSKARKRRKNGKKTPTQIKRDEGTTYFLEAACQARHFLLSVIYFLHQVIKQNLLLLWRFQPWSIDLCRLQLLRRVEILGRGETFSLL